jgi:hypothetical protein
MLPVDLKELLLVFNANGVEYLVVGGHAVGLHSEPRATKDLDVFIRSSKKNSEAVYRALAIYGAPLGDVTPEVFNDGKSAFQIGVEPYRIDILQQIDGVAFEVAWMDRVQGTLEEGVPASFISREHLIQNKLASGRHIDLHDVDALRGAAEQSPKRESRAVPSAVAKSAEVERADEDKKISSKRNRARTGKGIER